MIAALLLLLATTIHAGVVRAPVELGRLPVSAASTSGSPGASLTGSPMLPSYLSVANPADALEPPAANPNRPMISAAGVP